MPSKPKPASSKALVAPAALGAVGDANSTYSVRFGVILDINGKSVPITADDLLNAKTNGVEFTLQEPTYLGSIDEFEAWVSAQFQVSLPTAADLPSPLNDVVGAITGMKVTVEKAHLKVPGTSTPNASVQFTIEANGTFSPEIPLIAGKLGIQGMVFGFSNEDTAAS